MRFNPIRARYTENLNHLLKMQSIIAKNQDDIQLDINYQDVKLEIVNNQLCFVDRNDNFMPICRISTLEKLFQ